MNQDRVLEILQKTMPTNPMPTVIFSGKTSKKKNGLYNILSHEIIIHNRNFDNDRALLYTAFHEYAHHIQTLKTGKTGHNKQFWATVNNLIDLAIEKGLYTKADPDETMGIHLTEVRKALKDHATLEADIGDLLFQLQKDCNRNSLRFEEVVDRELKIKRTTSNRFMAACKNYQLFPEDEYANADMLAVVAKSTKAGLKDDIVAVVDGSSIYAPTIPLAVEAEEDEKDEQYEYVKLAKKRDRLDRTIGKLTEERIRVEQTMSTIQGKLDHEAVEA